MLKSPDFPLMFRRLPMDLAPVAAALVVVGCSTSPETYRLEAEIGDTLGFPQGATATREASRWTIERRVYAYGQTRRVRLSSQDSLALDNAVADPALYASPVPRSECIDAPSIALDVIVDGTARRLTLGCEISPGLDAVLHILFGWPKATNAPG